MSQEPSEKEVSIAFDKLQITPETGGSIKEKVTIQIMVSNL